MQENNPLVLYQDYLAACDKEATEITYQKMKVACKGEEEEGNTQINKTLVSQRSRKDQRKGEPVYDK